MDSEDSFNPQAEQEQERLVLQSILMDEFHVPSKQPSRGTKVEIRILPFPSEQSGENHTEVLLTAFLEPSYPIVTPRIDLKAVRGLSDGEVKDLDGELTQLISELAGHTQLMALTEHARDFLRERNKPEQSLYEQMQMQQRAAPSKAAVGAPSSLGLESAILDDESLGGIGGATIRLEEVEAELDEAARRKGALQSRGKGRAKKMGKNKVRDDG